MNEEESVIMATAKITPDQDSVICELHIAAPPERVFQAITDPKQVMQWWTSEQCQIESFSLEPRRGGRWTYDTKQTEMNINGISKFHCDGEVLEFDPPRVVAFTWIATWHEVPAQRTVVRWELTPEGKGTRARVTHSGLAQLPASRKDYSQGWVGVIGQLKKFVEMGHSR
jgi:uncharacterized protein YndB with AHSA1/START domain